MSTLESSFLQPSLLLDLLRHEEMGFVTSSRLDDLRVFKYTQSCVTENFWNSTTRQARGIIIRDDGAIIARPFSKFFNLGEQPETQFSALPDLQDARIMEKIDGSCAVSYIHKGIPRISTLGSFSSEQSAKALEILYSKYPSAINLIKQSPNMTFIFEVIYPENRIVVDYGEEECLYLLGARYLSGEELHPDIVEEIARIHNIPFPKIYTINEFDVEFPSYELNREGVVIYFHETGLRVKMKSPWYVRIHKLKDYMSPKSILEMMLENDLGTIQGRKITVQLIKDSLPLDMSRQVDDIVSYLSTRQYDILALADKAFNLVKDFSTRKEQAIYINEFVPKEIRSLVFSLLDGKDIRKQALKVIKNEISSQYAMSLCPRTSLPDKTI